MYAKFINSLGAEIKFTDTAPLILQHIDISNSVNIYNSKGMGQDGSTYNGNTLDIKDITVQVALNASNSIELDMLRDKINATFNPKLNEGYLIYKNKKIKCIVNKLPYYSKNINNIYCECLIQLTAHNPFWQDLKEKETNLVSWIPNLEFPENEDYTDFFHTEQTPNYWLETTGNKLEIVLKEPFRGLPNGVRDVAKKDTVERRIGKHVLNGGGNWNTYLKGTNENYYTGYVKIENGKINSKLLCDKFVSNVGSDLGIKECVFGGSGGTSLAIFISVLKLKLTQYGFVQNDITTYVQAFKSWLSQNSTTVFCELTTPIIEKLPKALVLQSFEKDNLQVNTVVQPFISVNFENIELQGNTLYKRSDGTYTDEWERGCTLESVGEKENNKIEVINSKNLFDINSNLENKNCCTHCIENNSLIISVNNSVGNAFVEKQIKLKPNTHYTLSYSKKILSGVEDKVYSQITNKTGIAYFTDTTGSGGTFKTDADGNILLRFYVCIGGGKTTTINYYNIQLEEGTEITSYKEYNRDKSDFEEFQSEFGEGVGQEWGYRELKQIVEVDNVGDVKCPIKVVFRASADVEKPFIQDIESYELIRINKTLKSGDTLEITTGYGNKNVFLNGKKAHQYLDFLNSSWLQLKTGTNLIKYGAEKGLENLECTIFYTPLYLGV